MKIGKRHFLGSFLHSAIPETPNPNNLRGCIGYKYRIISHSFLKLFFIGIKSFELYHRTILVCVAFQQNLLNCS